jgi:hypothetical protein
MKKVISILLLLLTIPVFYGCKKKEPTCQITFTITNVASNSATIEGNIPDCFEGDIFVRGVCWSTNKSPTIEGTRTTDGYGTGTFTSSLIGLTPNNLYYIRAYAVNYEGTLYSAISQFKTLN